ncbi:DUF2953 domain-containing protein [Paenibacillus sp. SYP-B3998]|nr:DUF2953 domain-containing protein [Paenibacillus sp. SYP-B3998]
MLFGVGMVVLVILFMLIVVMSSFIRGEFYFSRVKDNDTLSVEMRALFGLVRYRYVIPIIQFKGFGQGIMIKSETVTKSNSKSKSNAELKDAQKEHITKEKIISFYKKAKIALVNTLHLYDWMKMTLAKVECTELRWTTRVGVGDAPETAITTGAIWAIKSSLLGFGIQYIKLQTKPMIDVVPQYNQMHFDTELRAAGRIRVWFVLLAGVRLVVRAAKVKGGLRAWIQILHKTRPKTVS